MKDSVDSNKIIYVAKEPLYHECSFSDVIASDNFYLGFNKNSIDLFWNPSPGAVTEVTRHFNIPGLESFFLVPARARSSQTILYTIQSSTLRKYVLSPSNGSVYVMAPQELKHTLFLELAVQCDPSKYPVLTLNNEFAHP